MVGPNKHRYTHMRAQCSHASVGLAQARPNYDIPLNSEHNEGEEGNTVCGRPGQKSNSIPLCISSTLLCSKCCVTKISLKAGLIHASYRLMTN